MKIKKIMAGILTVALMIGALSFAAVAEEEHVGYRVYIGEAEFTPTTLTMTKSTPNSGIKSGSATYDPDSNTLTLDNITVGGKAHKYFVNPESKNGTLYVEYAKAAVVYDGEYQMFSIVLKGKNTITGVDVQLIERSDDGKIVTVFNNSALGINNYPATITSDGTGELICDGTSANTIGHSYGIYAASTLDIVDCTVTAIGGTSPTTCGFGIYSGYGINIENSTVSATSKMSGSAYADSSSYGIYTKEKSIKITDSDVTAKSGTANYNSAICSGQRRKNAVIGEQGVSGDIIIKNSKVTAIAADGALSSYGMISGRRISIAEGSTVNISSGTGKTIAANKTTSCAIATLDGDLYVTDSTLAAKASKAYSSVGAAIGNQDDEDEKAVIRIRNSSVTLSGETTSTITDIELSFEDDNYNVLVDTKTDGKTAAKYKGDKEVYYYKYYSVSAGHTCYVKNMGITDVPDKSWYHEAVDYVLGEGMMKGTSATTFEPNGIVTRAQFAQILYNMEGNPAIKSKNVFTDVKEGKWYYNAVIWAYENGITSGTSKTTFTPDGQISRQEMATLLYRYAKYKGYKVLNTETLSAYPDKDSVGKYYVDSMKWAVANGIITGKSANGTTTLSPDAKATRSEVATIFMRFDKIYG